MEASTRTDQPATTTMNPSKPRRLRGKRLLAVAFLLFLAAIFATHKAWTVGAGRKLARQVAEYRARGEPIEPADFNVGVVPDDDNAALDLRAASAAIDRTSAAWKAWDEARDNPALPLRDEESKYVRALVEGNPKVFPLIEAATKKRGADWGVRFRTPVINVLLPDLQRQRELAQFLKMDALLAHTDGDDARAVRRVRDVLFVGRASGNQPILVGHLVSLGITNLAVQALEDVVEELRVGDGGGEVSPQQVRDAIADLLDEGPVTASQRQALLGERMMQLDMARAFANGKITPMGAPPTATWSAVSVLIKPTALSDARMMIRHMSDGLAAFDKASTWPQYKATGPAVPEDIQKRQWRHLAAAMFLPSLDRAMETHYRSLTERRMAATMLGVRLYAADHSGRTPDALDRLVPRYLPAVPADPFAPTTQPLKYIPGADPLVYSVGVNNADDGGSEQAQANRNPKQATRWEQLDAVMHFKRRPRPAPEPLDDGVGGFSTTSPTTGETVEEPTTAPKE
jgi:hypothetical protein